VDTQFTLQINFIAVAEPQTFSCKVYQRYLYRRRVRKRKAI